ncbi:MAG TPA: hypothetical protein VHZ74_26180 [Bryobacteraceae bacterium]|nr:hypothetical protein [Bryobacteraceae bacterium]
MKPLHIGLLVAGAGIAGGLAVKMTQAPPIPAPAPVAITAPVARPAPPPPVQQVLNAPAASAAEAASKPSPIPAPAAAPAPIYDEPVRRAPHRNKPVVIARAKPTQWLPQPYAPPPVPTAAEPEPSSAAPLPAIEQAASPTPAPEPPAPRQVTLPTGATIAVWLNQSLSTERAMPGDTFWASLAEPIVVDGLVIAERGARVSGRITASQPAGRVSGTAVLTLSLSTILTSDGQRVAISTDPWTKQGDTSRSADVAKIGGGAALGAIIGAIAGGGKGAAIGAGVGGGAGAGAVMASRGKSASLPSETVIRFRLASRVTITEQIATR